VKGYFGYTTDAGRFCAVFMDSDYAAVMGFAPAPVGTEKQPKGLLTRKQLFVNFVGRLIRLSSPTTAFPYEFAYVTIKGDPTFMAVGTIEEIDHGRV